MSDTTGARTENRPQRSDLKFIRLQTRGGDGFLDSRVAQLCQKQLGLEQRMCLTLDIEFIKLLNCKNVWLSECFGNQALKSCSGGVGHN